MYIAYSGHKISMLYKATFLLFELNALFETIIKTPWLSSSLNITTVARTEISRLVLCPAQLQIAYYKVKNLSDILKNQN